MYTCIEKQNILLLVFKTTCFNIALVGTSHSAKQKILLHSMAKTADIYISRRTRAWPMHHYKR
jgi:hypothetical protein